MRRIANIILIVIAAIGFGAYLARDSWKMAQKEEIRAQQAHRKMLKAESSRVKLIQERAELQSESGREKVARDRGFTKPGEIPVQ